MKLIFTADWHLGHRNDDLILDSCRQIIKHANTIKPAAMVVCGDILDRVSSPSTRNNLVDILRDITEVCPAIIIKGNHDAVGDLPIYSRIKSKNPVIVTEQPGIIMIGKLRLFCLPWFSKAAWVSSRIAQAARISDADVSKALLGFLKSGAMISSEMMPMASIPGDDTEGIILAGHLMVSGAKAQHRQPLISSGIQVSAGDICDSGFDAAIVGHIHLHQLLSDLPIAYPGSIAALDFGETPDKYVLAFDTKSMDYEAIRLNTIPMYELSGQYDPRTDQVTIIDAGGLDHESKIKGAMVRFYCRIALGQDTRKAEAAINRLLGRYQPRDIRLYPQVMAESQARSEGLPIAKSLSEKLSNYWRAFGEPEEETKSDMLAKLELLESEVEA